MSLSVGGSEWDVSSRQGEEAPPQRSGPLSNAGAQVWRVSICEGSPERVVRDQTVGRMSTHGVRLSTGCWSGIRGPSMIKAAWYEVSEPEWGYRVSRWERGSCDDEIGDILGD